MQLFKRVIQLAKERALFRFSALAQGVVVDARTNIEQTLSVARSSMEERNFSTALQLLDREPDGFHRRLEELFAENVERAMQTMYIDLRQELGDISAESLTLIDDETVNREIAVGHLVQRLRDDSDGNLARLNLMIAQLHGEQEIRERENPFRPYLIAGALNEMLREKIVDEFAFKILFAQMSNSLVKRLPEFYADLCEVFNSSGVHARLTARPSRAKQRRHHQPEQASADSASAAGSGGDHGEAGGGGSPNDAPSQNFSPQMLHTLQRVLSSLQQTSSRQGLSASDQAAGTAVEDTGSAQDALEHLNQSEVFQDFVWKIFNQGRATGTFSGYRPSERIEQNTADPYGSGSEKRSAPASEALISQLNQFQQLAASGQAVNDQISPEQNQLFAVGEQIAPEHATTLERVAIDVVALLFEFILEDEQIPATMRVQIGRLQIPFLKAAMLSPALLQDADHPARQLLNRMSSVTIGLDADTPMGQDLAGEITHLVRKILHGFDQDVAIFSVCLEELEQFLAEQLRHADADTKRSVEAMEQAEQTNVLLLNTASLVREILAPLAIDQRVIDFILNIWVRVLVRASAQQTAEEELSDYSAVEQYRDVLPELVWSAQNKITSEQRDEMIRLLPGLVKQLKVGLLLIQMPDEESDEALDQLVAVHTQVLRSGQDGEAVPDLPSLEQLRQQFMRLVIDKDSATWQLTEPPQIQVGVVEKALEEQGASASLDLERTIAVSFESDSEWLAQMKLGTCVECWSADTYVVARLIWISKHQSLYIMKIEANAKPLIYSSVSLLKALREGSVRLAEYAPTFERAVDSLMHGTESIQPDRRRRSIGASENRLNG